MAWARFECDTGEHDKWVSISLEARWLAFRVSCWAQKQAQLGRPTKVKLGLIESFVGKANASRLAKELEDAGKPEFEHGLLDPVDGGWEVHDLPNYLPTSAKLAEAGRKGAEKRWGANGKG